MSRNIFLVDGSVNTAGRWSSEFLELFDGESIYSNIESCLREIERQKHKISDALILCHIHDSGGTNERLRQLSHARARPGVYIVFFSGGGIAASQKWIEYCEELMDEGMLKWAGVLRPPVDGSKSVIDQACNVCTTFTERDLSTVDLKKELGSILRFSETSEEFVAAFSILLQAFLAVADVCGKVESDYAEGVVSRMGGNGRPWRGVEDVKGNWSRVSGSKWWKTTFRDRALTREKLGTCFQKDETSKCFDEFLAWLFDGSIKSEEELVTMMATLLDPLLKRE